VEKQRYLLAVGRLVPEKGFHLLIEAHSRLPRAQRWKLVIGGGSSHDRAYERRLNAAASRAGDVVLAGELRRGSLHDLYSHAGAFVQASTHEGMAFSALEALSYGLPVFASDIAANRALELDDESYFPAADVRALTERLWRCESTLVAQRPRPELLRVDAEQEVRRVARRTLAVYQDLTSARPRSLDRASPMTSSR
jgi:glycosyltransferase involved in cell wall biosynthesis